MIDHRLFDKILVSPNYHALHHTKNNDNCNFGGVLMIWDHLFNTYKQPTNSLVDNFDFGVKDWHTSSSLFDEQIRLK